MHETRTAPSAHPAFPFGNFREPEENRAAVDAEELRQARLQARLRRTQSRSKESSCIELELPHSQRLSVLHSCSLPACG